MGVMFMTGNREEFGFKKNRVFLEKKTVKTGSTRDWLAVRLLLWAWS
jgi:hypothetical protein